MHSLRSFHRVRSRKDYPSISGSDIGVKFAWFARCERSFLHRFPYKPLIGTVRPNCHPFSFSSSRFHGRSHQTLSVSLAVPPPVPLADIFRPDLLAAVRKDPRFLPILPVLFANSTSNLYPHDSIVPMFYNMLDIENIYAPELQQCQYYFLVELVRPC